MIKALPANAALLSVNEKGEMKAQRTFYEKMKINTGTKRSRRLRFCLSGAFATICSWIHVCLLVCRVETC